MKFASYQVIVGNYIFLKEVIEKLENNYFPLMTKSEIIEDKRSIIKELKHDTAFKLLSKLEADIRTDYNQTINSKFKDALSRKYIQLCQKLRENHKKKGKKKKKIVCRKTRLDDILDTVKLYFQELGNPLSRDCSVIKGYFNGFRNWYAHGRYYQKPLAPDPEDIERIYLDFENEIFNRKRR